MSVSRNSRTTPTASSSAPVAPATTVPAAASNSRLAAAAMAAARRGAHRTVEFKPRRPTYVAAKALGGFVPGLTKKSFEKFGFATAQLITDWSDVAGRDVARYTLPERIRWPRLPAGSADDGEGGRGAATLILRVDPARALDIEYKRAQLMERINIYFGYRAVADIRIVQGAVETTPAKAGPSATPQLSGRAAPAPAVSSAPPAPATPGMVDTVADEGLRQALARMEASIRTKSTAPRCLSD